MSRVGQNRLLLLLQVYLAHPVMRWAKGSNGCSANDEGTWGNTGAWLGNLTVRKRYTHCSMLLLLLL